MRRRVRKEAGSVVWSGGEHSGEQRGSRHQEHKHAATAGEPLYVLPRGVKQRLRGADASYATATVTARGLRSPRPPNQHEPRQEHPGAGA